MKFKTLGYIVLFLVLLAVTLQSALAINESDIIIWSDFTGSGTTLTDERGYQNGTITGTLTRGTSDKPSGLPYSLTGSFSTSNYAQWSSDANTQNLDSTVTRTVIFWTKNINGGGFSGDYQAGSGSTGHFGVLSGQTYFYLLNGANPLAYGGIPVAELSGWNMHAGVINSGTSSIEYWINGEFRNSTSYSTVMPISNTVARKLGVADESGASGSTDGIAQYIIIEDNLTTTEWSCLYNSGAGRNYSSFVDNCLGTPASGNDNFSTVSSASYNFNTPVTIGASFGTVNSITLTSDNATAPYYITSVLTTNASTSSTAVCRISIDGTPQQSETRTLSAGTLGNLKIITHPVNLSIGNHTVITECQKSGGANYIITNSEMVTIHLNDDNTQTPITYQSINSTGLAVNTTDTELASFTFTTDNTTNTTNKPSIIVHGRATYTYGTATEITTYLKNVDTGEVCGNYTRFGSGSGSVGTACNFDNLESNTTYNFSFHGFTTSGTGTINNLLMNVYNINVNNTASNNFKFDNVSVSGGSEVVVGSVNITNVLGGNYKVFVDAGIMVTGNATETAYFYLNNTESSIMYYRTLSTSGAGNINTMTVFDESGTGTHTYDLVAYCPSGCTINSGDLTAFVTDSSTASTGTFGITAYNVYNSSAIDSFNATIGGTTYTTTNGTINALGQGTATVTIQSENFFINTTSHDTTTSLNASMKAYTEIRAVNYDVGGTQSSFTLNSSVGNYTTTNGIAYLPIVTNTTRVTITGDSVATTTENVTLTQYYNFTVYARKSLLINIYNGTTTNLLTQLVTIDSVGTSTSQSNTTSTGTIYLKLNNPDNYELRFTSSDFVTQSIFLTITNTSTETVNIYMISNSTSTDLIKVQVLNLEGGEVEGAIVRLQKQAINQSSLYYNVDEKETSSEGKTAFYVTKSLEDYYRFIVVYNDEVKLTTVPTFFVPTVDETIVLEINTVTGGGVNVLGTSLSSSLVASGNSSETYTFTWVDGKNEVTGGRLIITTQDLNYTNFAPSTLYDSGLVSGFSGSIAYTLPVVNDTRFLVNAYAVYNDDLSLLHSIPVIFGHTVTVERNTGLLLGLLVFLIVVLLTLTLGPLFSGLLGFIALLGLSLVGLVEIPIAIISSFMAFLFIVFVKIKGGGQ